MRIAPYSPAHRPAWDALCDASEDAWFWHARDWFDYAAALTGPGYAGDASFVVEDAGELLAVAPAMAIRNRNDRSLVELGLADQPAPWPAFAPGLDTRQRHEA